MRRTIPESGGRVLSRPWQPDRAMNALTAGESFGPYRVLEGLGRGGMASVYKAYEPGLDRYVALKVLPPEFLREPTFAERFRREAQVVARLEHPNIVPVHAFGIEQGIPWMAMRFVGGGSLSTLIRNKPLDAERAAAILASVAEALDYAHGKGVIHRDVKPPNILISDDGHIYLADFGIARIVEGSATLTEAGMVAGTPQYMSPEQALGKPADERSDIYALGILAYELLAGRVPFTADTPVAVLLKHAHAAIPEPPTQRVPPEVLRILLKCLAKNPDHRWPTATAFVQALSASLRRQAGSVATKAARQRSPMGSKRRRLREVIQSRLSALRRQRRVPLEWVVGVALGGLLVSLGVATRHLERFRLPTRAFTTPPDPTSPSRTPASIAAAIAVARPGSTITVPEGAHDELVVVNKSITLRGMGPDRSSLGGLILRGPAGTNVVLENLTVTGALPGAADCKQIPEGCGNAIVVREAVMATLRNVRAMRAGDTGIWVSDSAGVLVKNSLVSNNRGAGIVLAGSAKATIVDTAVTKNKGAGIRVDDSSSLSLNKVTVSENDRGISARRKAIVEMEDGSIKHNVGGFAEGAGVFADNDARITLRRVVVEGNGRACLQQVHATYASWSCNGIVLAGQSELILGDSTVRENNEWGVAVLATACGSPENASAPKVTFEGYSVVEKNNRSNHLDKLGNPGKHPWNRSDVPPGQVCLP